MGERVSHENTRSRRLPPPEAWKNPDKWIDLSTGLAKPNVPKLILPTDDRAFLNPDEVVDLVEDTFFWKDYDWPYSPDDQETAPDDHHFYFTEVEYSPSQNNGSYIPSRFRELPTVIGRMPRQFHNTIHDFTVKPEMPTREAMYEYSRSYMLAHQAFKNLIESAKNTTQASHSFNQRKKAVQEGLIIPPDPEDMIAMEILKDFFSKHFNAYGRSIDKFINLPQRSLIVPHLETIPQYKPHLVVKKMSRYMVKNSINYVPILRAGADRL